MKDSPENKTSKLYFTPMDFSVGDRFDEAAQKGRLKTPLPDSVQKFSGLNLRNDEIKAYILVVDSHVAFLNKSEC